MLDAYLDESGVHDEAPICVIAGYFSGRGWWRKFERDYRKTLKAFDVPLEKVHAKDLIKRVGFFHGWPDSKHSKFIAELAMTVANYRNKIHPVSGALSIADFNSLSLTERRFSTGAKLTDGKLVSSGCASKPYFVVFQGVIRRLAEYAPTGGKAHFFVGLDRPFYEYANVLFKQNKNFPVATGFRDRLGDIAAPEAKTTPQLQIADLLSYMTYCHTQERLANNDWDVPPNDVLNVLLSGLISKEDHLFHSAASLKARLDQIPPEAWGDLRTHG